MELSKYGIIKIWNYQNLELLNYESLNRIKIQIIKFVNYLDYKTNYVLLSL